MAERHGPNKTTGSTAGQEAAEPDEDLISLALPTGLARALDAWIATQLDPKPPRSEAILRLLREALAARFGS
ncbi:MAG: hypothetical protein NVSMB26_09210 [Beijerinckiaceae bacterium]